MNYQGVNLQSKYSNKDIVEGINTAVSNVLYIMASWEAGSPLEDSREQKLFLLHRNHPEGARLSLLSAWHP